MLSQKRYPIMIALGMMILLQMACGQTSRTSDEKSIAATVAKQVRATLTAEAQRSAANTAVAVAPSDTPKPTETTAPTATSAPTETPAPTATDTPTSLPTDTPVPTDTPTVTETPTADNTNDLIVNAPAILGAKVAEVEGTLGKPLDIVQIDRGSVDAIPEGGESRTYKIQEYLLYVDYDKTGIAKGVQLFSGLEKYNYALSEWPVILRRVGVDFIAEPPDVSALIAVAWTNVNGYAVRVETDAIGGKIWSVWVSLVSSNPRPANTPDKPAAIASNASNIRSGPGTSYPIVGKASAGQRYDILGRNADSSWWQISYGDKQGWIAASVVKTSGPLDAGGCSTEHSNTAPCTNFSAGQANVPATHAARAGVHCEELGTAPLRCEARQVSLFLR
ncbi:SH3 domain-containing protein [Candidatus Amarolinea dominans]|uniref:SH3 domain-containing protein n=1 Tax=Candidatus Amarolinea dominans TaxID=3140696 RepID=UPI001D245659|nr:SH3 domain-containing protein [Anaerolineae bacterium]